MSRGAVLLATFLIGATLALAFALHVDLAWFEGLNTYGDFDAPSSQAFVQYLWTGTADAAGAKHYTFGHGVHWTPVVALFIVFAVFLALRAIRAKDLKLGIYRWLTAWGAFVVARFGLLRVSGAAPVKRCTYGVFPFLNCQACEMASGGCPIGTLQGALNGLRFPLLPLTVMFLTGLALGRWICGWLCPFGLLSDIFDRVSKHVVRPRTGWAAMSFVVLGLIFVVPLVTGLLGGAGWLPFCSTLCPSGSVFGLLPYYATTGAGEFGAAFTPGHTSALLAILFHTAVLVLFVWAAVKISGRVFCKYLCPLGAFLGLFHRVSLIRVVHLEEPCTDCGKCSKGCPMGINLADPGLLTQSNCIRCGHCVKFCPTDARKWVFGWQRPSRKEVSDGKVVAAPADAQG